jgi:hypothetical protein
VNASNWVPTKSSEDVTNLICAIVDFLERLDGKQLFADDNQITQLSQAFNELDAGRFESPVTKNRLTLTQPTASVEMGDSQSVASCRDLHIEQFALLTLIGGLVGSVFGTDQPRDEKSLADADLDPSVLKDAACQRLAVNIMGRDSAYIGAIKDMIYKVTMSKRLCCRKGFEHVFCSRHSCRTTDEFVTIIREKY